MCNAFLALLAFCLLIAAAPASAKGSFVYVSNYGDGTISQFRVKPNGTLTPLSPPAVRAYVRCHSLVADPSHRFLYVLSGFEYSHRNCVVSQFRIGADGKLSPLSPARIVLPDHNGAAPHTLIMDPSGRFLYVLNYRGSITQFLLSPNGGLVLVKAEAISVFGGQDFSAAFGPYQSTLYITSQFKMINERLGGVDALQLQPDGSLRGINHSMPDNGYLTTKYARSPPQQVLVSFQTQTVYFLYEGFATSPLELARIKSVLTQYRAQRNGVLTALNPPQIQAPGTPQEAVIDPHSHYCYVIILPQYQDGYYAKTNKVILTRYPIRRNGTLGQAAQQTFAAPAGLFGPVFDSSSHTLYLLTRKGIRPFRVKPNGAVMPLTPQSIRAGRGPLGMIYVQN